MLGGGVKCLTVSHTGRKEADAPLELAGSHFMAAFPVVIGGNDGETPPSDEEQWTPTWPSSTN